MKKVTSLFVALMLVVGLVACASAEGQYLIGLSMPMSTSLHFQAEQFGVEKAAAASGKVEKVVTVCANGYDDVEGQINQIQDLINMGCDAIIVIAGNADSVVPVELEAIESGIIVVNMNNASNTDRVTSKINSDNYAMGYQSGMMLGDALGGEGAVIIATATVGSALVARGDGFRAAIEENYPNIEILVEHNTGTDAADAAELMNTWLQTYPEVNGVFTWCDGVGTPVAKTCIEAGRADVKVVSIDVINPDVRNALSDGTFFACVAQQPVLIGETTIDTLLSALAGEEVEPQIYVDSMVVFGSEIDEMDLSTIVPAEAE